MALDFDDDGCVISHSLLALSSDLTSRAAVIPIGNRRRLQSLGELQGSIVPFSPIGDEAADDAIANPKNHIRVKTTVAYPFNDATNNA